jgi:hypothetical protein
MQCPPIRAEVSDIANTPKGEAKQSKGGGCPAMDSSNNKGKAPQMGGLTGLLIISFLP